MKDFGQALQDFAQRIGSAPSESEGLLFGEALDLLGRSSGGRPRGRLRGLIGLEAFYDAAVGLYRLALPGYGFQFGLPPPLPNGLPGRPIATAWRRGDHSAIPYHAATSPLALLAAAAGQAAQERETADRAECGLCFGVGWYLTAAKTKQMCRRCRD